MNVDLVFEKPQCRKQTNGPPILEKQPLSPALEMQPLGPYPKTTTGQPLNKTTTGHPTKINDHSPPLRYFFIECSFDVFRVSFGGEGYAWGRVS